MSGKKILLISIMPKLITMKKNYLKFKPAIFLKLIFILFFINSCSRSDSESENVSGSEVGTFTFTEVGGQTYSTKFDSQRLDPITSGTFTVKPNGNGYYLNALIDNRNNSDFYIAVKDDEPLKINNIYLGDHRGKYNVMFGGNSKPRPLLYHC